MKISIHHLRRSMILVLVCAAVGAQAQGDCQNVTQFPDDAVMVTSQGQPQTINECNYFGEFAHLTGILAGEPYDLTVTDNGYITVREGSIGGPVLGQGMSPVSVIANTSADLFVHFNGNAACTSGSTCQITTVTAMLYCTPPMATTTIFEDCATGQFSIELNVASTGDGPTVDVRQTVSGGAEELVEGVGVGILLLGPFANGDSVGVTVMHVSDELCDLDLGMFVAPNECPVEVVCGQPALQETYCYGPLEVRSWSYAAVGSGTLRLKFLRGTIENSQFDRLRIYDGPDEQAPVAFVHNNSDDAMNLGPDGSALLNTLGGYYGLEINSSTGRLFMELLSDASVNCGSTVNFDAWEWEVVCGDVTLTGRCFLDDDLDCAWDQAEPVLQQTIVEVQPGPYYATTNANGQYFMVLPEGGYTVEQVSGYVTDHCNSSPQPFSVVDLSAQVQMDFPDTAATAIDLAVMLSSGPARVGFEHQQAVAVRNLSARTSGPISLVMEVDPLVAFASAEPPPTTTNGSTLIWDLSVLNAFQQTAIQVYYQVPANVELIDSTLITTATVATDPQEDLLTNNTTTHARTITAAYDPNDKVASTSSRTSGTTYFLDVDEWIDYTIRFQNTGNDTAFTVVITDTLPASLDPSTLMIGASSHPFSWDLRGAGNLVFTFANILLPDSNVNEPRSHGFVSFRIQPRQPLAPGTVIENIANIHFDFNPPIITEPSVLVAEFSTGVGERARGAALQLMPNPARSELTVRMDGGTEGAELRILALDGRVVRTMRMNGSMVVLDVAHLASGTYLLEWRAPGVVGLVERFIKD